MSDTGNTPRLPSTFNRLAWSNLAAQSAEQIALAAAPIVAVLLLGVGEGQTGLLQTALTLPFILFAIPAGLLADRISRRLLMAGAEALRAAALAAILLLIWFGRLTLPLLALLGFVAVCGTVVYSVAAPALVPSLVTPQSVAGGQCADRTRAHHRLCQRPGARRRAGRMGRGARPAFGFAAALSVDRGRAAVRNLRAGARRRAAAPSAAGDQGRRRLRACIMRCCGRCSSPSSSSTPARSCCSRCSCLMRCVISDLSATGVGTALAMYGVGMVVGALLATRVMRRLAFGTVIGLGPVTGFVAAVVMALTTAVPRRRCSRASSFFLLGVGPILWVISTTTLRQSVTPPRLLGRVSAINIMSYGARPLGSGARRHRRRALRRGSLPLSRGRDLRRAGAGDPALACGRAGAAAGDGGRRP